MQEVEEGSSLVYIFAAVLLAILAFILYMWIEGHRNVVYHNELNLDNLPKGFDGVVFFFITDIHRRVVADRMIEQAKESRAQWVVIGGDLAEKGVPFERIEKNIDRLAEIGPIYFVWGNNDYEVDFRRLDALLYDKGVTVLDNTAVSLQAGEDVIQLLGVDDYGLRRSRLDLAVEDAHEGYRILISHNPALAYNIINELARIRLVLSGHTHGGQIRLLGWGPREKGGIKRFSQLALFISNGYGTTMLPLRLGAPAQTHILTFKSR